MSLSAVFKWPNRARTHGDEAAVLGGQLSQEFLSARTLSLAQEWRLRLIIVVENPPQLSVPFAQWSRRTVVELVK